jgi:DNA-binding GntR family transcriptional regulator
MSAFAAQILVRLDASSPESLQAQLCAGLRRAIRAGVLGPGHRLPSSRALAADLRISRTTAVLAYDQLIAEGILATRAGSGTRRSRARVARCRQRRDGGRRRIPRCRGGVRPSPRCPRSP